MNEKKQSQFSDAVMKATGEIEFKFTNDAMFKLVLQDNEKVLRGIISAMLHIPECEIRQLKVENPIVLGESVNDKTFVLDIKVSLNNKVIINLEMQLLDYNNWRNRSLSYLCRNFDNLQKGEDYLSTKSVIHIGFLDFDLFEDDEEFYSRFSMLNVKNYREYNSNFKLNVLYLNRIENATQEDKNWKIDEWARLFKACKWEDLRMIAQENDTMISAVETMYYKQSDEMALEIMRRKQDEIDHQRRMQKEHDAMQKKHDAMQKKHDAMQKKHDAMQKEHDAMQKEVEKLAKYKEELTRDKEALLKENSKLMDEIEQLRKQLNAD